MSLEAELREALSYRNEMAVSLAVSLLRLATEYGMGPSYISDRGIVGGKYANIATDIEALTAVVLQRCGVSWEAMAARADTSRQALHRRLSSRGEELFDDAVHDVLSDREYDEEVLVEALHGAENIEDVFERKDALSDLPTTTELLVETLIAMPSPEEILTAPAELASNLVELRHTPRWWARNAWEDEDDDWDE
ncbi:hypothetical protein ABQE57_05975 [Mycolicibacterium elephantis]